MKTQKRKKYIETDKNKEELFLRSKKKTRAQSGNYS